MVKIIKSNRLNNLPITTIIYLQQIILFSIKHKITPINISF